MDIYYIRAHFLPILCKKAIALRLRVILLMQFFKKSSDKPKNQAILKCKFLLK